MRGPIVDLDALSTEERLELVEEVWEHLCREESDVPASDTQRAELDKRLDDLDRDPQGGIPWDEVLRRLRARDR